MKDCKVFTKNFHITKIEKYSITEGAKAYDHVFDVCQTLGATVDFTVKDSSVPLKTSCPKDMPKREGLYQIISI